MEALPPITLGPCGAPDPFRLSGLPGGVSVSPPITVTCPMAEGLAAWSREVGDLARSELKQGLAALSTGTHYECRGQNHVATAKLSEHAFANALDLAGFRLTDGTVVPVTFAGDDAAGRFLAAARQAACRHFTTVLGPGSDSSHASHLHLDLRARKNGYRICQ